MPNCPNCGKSYRSANRHELPSGKYNCGTRRNVVVDGFKISLFSSLTAIVKSLVTETGPRAHAFRQHLYQHTFKSAREQILALERKRSERRRSAFVTLPPPTIPTDSPYRRCVTCKYSISLPTSPQCLKCFSDSLLCL